ncbi:hypothetical protein [Pseudoalteromonas sp.]|uniref:hypothetical protein n=1 Tax=Pseudoalteromonas sp. TaxID=53249 RepID=UPI003562E44C
MLIFNAAKRIILLVGISLFFSAFTCALETATSSASIQPITQIKVIPTSFHDFKSHDYYTTLLKLALEKTKDSYGEAEVVITKEMLVQDRFFKELNAEGAIDVYWTVTSITREQQAIPIRVPLLNGIMGYRVSIILNKRLNEFKQHYNETYLKKMIAGQGHDWPDYNVLTFNDFLVLGTSNYNSIIELLKRRRIDHFPRAINEALVELETLKDNELALEPNILLHYPSYIFFFVSKSNPELAKRLEYGLALAIADGSFQCVFEKYIDINRIRSQLNLPSRRLVSLDNPLLSEQTRKLALQQIWQIDTSSKC